MLSDREQPAQLFEFPVGDTALLDLGQDQVTVGKRHAEQAVEFVRLGVDVPRRMSIQALSHFALPRSWRSSP